MSKLKELRKEKKLTQREVARLMGISLRSYKSYENDADKKDSIKYKYILEHVSQINPIDEEHGIVDIEYIKEHCEKIFKNYDVEFCYLFGSYAKNKAKENSDVDLLISTKAKGLKYYELIERLRSTLKKEVDVLDLRQLEGNIELMREVLRDGIKIYG